jgi:DNA-binding MarR family transcriptional regulator
MNTTAVTETSTLQKPCLPRELLLSPLFVLGRVGYSIKLLALDEFERIGFSPYHHSVLALLEEGSRETQATIADALKLDRSQLVGLLDGLEEKGLSERRRDPNDRRRHLVGITDAGRKQLAEFRKLVARVEDEVLAPLDAEERATLRDLVLRVAKHRDARFAPPDAS